jgi:hypothetical protein
MRAPDGRPAAGPQLAAESKARQEAGRTITR